jgi:hypothetical protein
MPKRFLLSAALWGGLVASSYAQTVDDQMRRVMNNLSHEYLQCSAYFAVVAVAAENSGNNELRDQYNQIGDTALANAIMVGEEANLLPEVHTARLELAVKEMAERINNDTANISILFRDYADLCKQAMEDIGARMDFWVNQELARPN